MKAGCMILLFLQTSRTNDIVEKMKFCSTLDCSKEDTNSVCGLRAEDEGFRLKLFENECELLAYGCNVDEEHAYGLINTEYCQRSFTANKEFEENIEYDTQKLNNVLFDKSSIKNDCMEKCIEDNTKQICGIRNDGIGFRIRLFKNKCYFNHYNCNNSIQFVETDLFICQNAHKIHGDENLNSDTRNITKKEEMKTVDLNNNYVDTKNKRKNLVVVNGGMLGQYENINDTIDTFFAASHVFDLPIQEVPINTRRKWLKNAGPVNVFVPWIVKPKNIHNDTLHRPTLSSCYHKCPFKCPDTYAPVCGTPGVLAREPSIMFQNHCFMDVAQCKMFWEQKSSTSHSSSYVESSFLFCMGDEMNSLYRFLPAIRTLQHMGRLKKKGKFRAVLKNFRYVSDFRSGIPKFMG